MTFPSSSGLIASLLLLFAQPVAAASMAADSSTVAPPARRLLPLMRQWQDAGGTIAVSPVVAIDPGATAAVEREARQLAGDLSASTAMRWQVLRRAPRRGEIALRQDGAGPDEGYRLRVGDSVSIESSGTAGLFYGGRTLLQMARLSLDAGRPSLPRGEGIDAPQTPHRIVMLDVGRRYYQMPNLLAFIRTMGDRKFNTLHLHFTDWSAFRLNSPRYPGLAPHGASYDRDDIRRLEEEAARQHVTIIPEIDLPGHAVALTDYRPALGFGCESMRTSPWLRQAAPQLTGKAWTVDVGSAENRAWLKQLLDTFIPWFSGPYLHVGGDEYQYDADKTRCPELMAAARAMGFRYPGDVMLNWLNEANAVVRAHGKRTIAWSWWGFRDDKVSIAPDKDIVVEVWNPGLQAGIMAAGNDVIVSPEDDLYVTPAEDLRRKDHYGLFDIDRIYATSPFPQSPQILGYALNVWSDGAERHTDNYFIGRADEPMMVMSERLWTGQARGPVDDLLKRADVLDAARPR